MPAGSSQRNPASDIHQEHPYIHLISSKATHIRNKDGTKLITVPPRKVSNPESVLPTTSSSSPPPPPPATMDYSNGAATNSSGKKKKKKKGKQAPPAQAQNSTSGSHLTVNGSHHSSAPPPQLHHPHRYLQDIKDSMAGYDEDESGGDVPEHLECEEEDDYYSDQDESFIDEPYSPPHSVPAQAAGKKKNKKKKKKAAASATDNMGAVLVPATQAPRKNKDRIWNTSTTEERERIKDFWLSLGEEERRSLVKVEKEAVLRKMKEQQKHSCSCSVCGRKRTAIEEELEVLYDAYYEELEQYANQQQNGKPLGGHVSLPMLAYSTPPPPTGPPPHHRGNHDHGDHNDLADEENDDEYEDDDGEYDDDEEGLDHSLAPPPPEEARPDFFNFGNSLTVQGGILTVADDLLKNDGKKFIEMMEQLAERRMAREEEANNANGTIQRDSNLHHHPHNHVAPTDYDEDEEDDDEYEDDEYEDDEDDEEEEPDTMTEEQRMEEGRRMFQIFAARMFEQRVLTAYREKVSRERQRKLLEELEEEELRRQEREEKKAKDKDKKKEKKRALKQSKEEERLRKEAERREEEEKQKAIDARKAEEQKRRKEELRLKREAEKKAAEEERHRKEEERKKRQQEEKEREAEKERKRKEHQERERKKKEEAAKKAKEEKEAREKEAREKREREEREKKEREAKAKKEAAEKEKKRKEDEAKARAEAAAQAAKRAQAFSQQPPITTTAPPPGYGSPHIPVVTPATPKQTAAAQLQRPRGSSQQGSMQGSQCSSPKTPNLGPRLGGSGSPSTPILQQNMPGPMPVKGFHYQGFPQTSPMPHHIGPPPGVNPPDMFNMSPLGGMNGPSPMQPFMAGMPQRQSIGNGIPMMPSGQMPFAHGPSYPRGFSNGLPMPMQQPPGMRPISSQGRGLFMQDLPMHPPPGVPYPAPGSPFINRAVDPIIMPSMGSHNRIPSGSFDSPHRQPAPIARPSSVAPTRASDEGVEEISKVMGSRALLEDDDEPLPENMSPARRVSAPFAPRPIRGVPSSNPFGDSLGNFTGFSDFGSGASWTNPLPLSGPGSLGASSVLSGSLPSAWANKAGWSDIDATYNRRRTTKVDSIRLLACKKWGEISGPHGSPVELLNLQRSVAQDAPPELQFRPEELGSILDIEGDAQNGGGSFEQKYENGRILVYFSPSQMTRQLRPGEIGSPSTSGATPFKSSISAPPGMTHPTVHPAGF